MALASRANDIIEVIFRKSKDGKVIAFFPTNVYSDGTITSVDANKLDANLDTNDVSLDFYRSCKPVKDKAEYRRLLIRLQKYYGCFFSVRQRLSK